MRKRRLSLIGTDQYPSTVKAAVRRPQVYLITDLLQPIQYARAECRAWPAMFDAAEVGLLALEQCRNSARPQEAPEAP